jgi:hypothetical protein
MEFLSNVNFGLFSTIFGLIALAGGAAGYFKASRGDSIIKYQAIENEGLRRRIGDVEKEKTELESDKKALEIACETKDDTIVELQKHNKYLQKLGQGSPQLKKLASVQEKLVVSIDNQTKAITALLQERK